MNVEMNTLFCHHRRVLAFPKDHETVVIKVDGQPPRAGATAASS